MAAKKRSVIGGVDTPLAQAPDGSRRLTGDMQLARSPSRPTDRDEDSTVGLPVRRGFGDSDRPGRYSFEAMRKIEKGRLPLRETAFDWGGAEGI
jgi:hypothetical protein